MSDVVGIGKTYIAALLAQQPDLMPEWKLVICPPVLQEYWDETFQEFGLSKYKVVSAGKINDIKNHPKFNDYRYVCVKHIVLEMKIQRHMKIFMMYAMVKKLLYLYTT